MGSQRYSHTRPNYVTKTIYRSVCSALWMMSLGAAGAALFVQSAIAQDNINSNEPVALPTLGLEIKAVRGLSAFL